MGLLDSILDALVVRKKKEGFEDATTKSPISDIVGFTTLGIVLIVLFFLFCFLYGVGAGRLSYCYSRGQGWSGGASFFWSVLSFFFANLYYPYYAFFNAPSCSPPVASMNYGTFTGGRRGGRR